VPAVGIAWARVHPACPGELVHSRVISPGYARVSIDEVHDDFTEFPLPIPPNEDMTTLILAKGTFIQWPKEDIRLKQKVPTETVSTHPSPTTLTPKMLEFEAPAPKDDHHTEPTASAPTPRSVAKPQAPPLPSIAIPPPPLVWPSHKHHPFPRK
jgi:hypothetical protein